MSTLAHYLESEGIASTLVSLIKYQSDAVRPPRALWVPYELGRPLGEPHDEAFQRAVLQAVIGLLDAPAGPVSEDYEVEAPSTHDNPDWQAPDVTGAPTLADELERLAPLHQAYRDAHGGSHVGLSQLAMADIAAAVIGYPTGAALAKPTAMAAPALSELVRLRYAVDDIKTYYLEAALGQGGPLPSSRQLHTWLWHGTQLAAALRDLRGRGLAADDAKFSTVADRFLIPRDWR